MTVVRCMQRDVGSPRGTTHAPNRCCAPHRRPRRSLRNVPRDRQRHPRSAALARLDALAV